MQTLWQVRGMGLKEKKDSSISLQRGGRRFLPQEISHGSRRINTFLRP